MAALWLATFFVGIFLAPFVAQAGSENQSAVDGFPLEVTDALGKRLVIQHPPERIVSLTPSNTETLFAVGAGRLVVGVTQYCNFPTEAQSLPKVGGFAARTISVEAIVALRPSLVIIGDENHRMIAEALQPLGIPTISIKVRNFEDLYASIVEVGRVTGHRVEAEQMVRGMRARVAAVVERVRDIPESRRVKVYWEVFDEPLMSAGANSIIGQEIALAGGINIFADLKEDYPHISAEAVIMRNPQVILGPKLMRAQSLTLERLSKRPGWSAIEAIKMKKVAVLPDEPVSRPCPRLVEGVELIAEQLYPEFFPSAKP